MYMWYRPGAKKWTHIGIFQPCMQKKTSVEYSLLEDISNSIYSIYVVWYIGWSIYSLVVS